MVIRIELTRIILKPRFLNFLRNSTFHFHMFFQLVICSWESRFRCCAGHKGEQFRLPSLIIGRDQLEHASLIQLVTGIATKPWLSWNMCPNIKTCENGSSNFSENLRIVAQKSIELTRFLSPNQSIHSNLL